jgi:amidase
MARTVKDAAYLLQAIAGKDKYDNYTSAIPFNGSLPDYVAACKPGALKGKRIGIPTNTLPRPINVTAPIIAAFEKAIEVLKEAGAIIVENTNYTAWEQRLNSSAEDFILSSDFKANLKQYLDQLTFNPNNVTTLEEVRNFTWNYPAEGYPSRDTAAFDGSLALNISYGSAEAWNYYLENQYIGGLGGLLGALQNYSLDAVVLPTRGASGISAIIGGPVVTIPMGAFPENTTVLPNARGNLNATAPNVPFGLAFAGAHWSEETLIGFAYDYEQRTKFREKIKPYIAPATELVDVMS